MGVAVIGSGVTEYADSRVCLIDDDGCCSVGVIVVASHIGENPVGCTAGDAGEAGSQSQTAQGLTLDSGSCPGSTVGVAVIVSGVTGDRNGSVGLVDDDGDRAVLAVEVSAAVKCPVGCAARNVDEGATQVQSGTQVRSADTGC